MKQIISISIQSINSRDLKKIMYLATTLYTENGQIVDTGFEIDKEKYLGRQSFDEPIMIKESRNFTNSLNYAINKILAMKQVLRLVPEGKVCINFLISVSENKQEAIDNLNECKVEDEILKIFEISKARSEEELKYLQVSYKQAEVYQEFLNYLLEPEIIKDIEMNINDDYEINSIWKFGISGDIPILTIKIQDISSIENLQEVIECYIELKKYIWIWL